MSGQMGRAARVALGAVVALAAVANGGEPPKKLYRWTDAKGVVHFGDSIPADATKQEHAELTAKGNVAALKGREPTAEEIAAREQADAEAQKRAAYDRSLLLTYTSDKDIEAARAEHLKAIDARIDNERKAVDEGQAKINPLRERLNRLPDNQEAQRADLEKQIAALSGGFNEHVQALARAESEHRETEARFDADLQRWRELRQAKASAPPG